MKCNYNKSFGKISNEIKNNNIKNGEMKYMEKEKFTMRFLIK